MSIENYNSGLKITVINRFPDWKRLNLERYFNLYNTTNVIVCDSSNEHYVPKHGTTLTLKYAFSGNEHYITNRCRYKVNDDYFLLLNKCTEYESYIHSPQDTHSFAVFFNPYFVKEFISSLIKKGDYIPEYGFFDNNIEGEGLFAEKLFSKDETIVPQLHALNSYVNNEKPDMHIINERLIILFDSLLALREKQFMDIGQLNYSKKSTKIELYRRLSYVKDYIISAYNEKLCIDELAEAACLNPNYMLREFRKCFKITPHQYLTQIRLQEAEKLLKHTSKTVTEISDELGFEFVSSFTNLFIKHFKISPRKYRSKHFSKSQFQIK